MAGPWRRAHLRRRCLGARMQARALGPAARLPAGWAAASAGALGAAGARNPQLEFIYFLSPHLGRPKFKLRARQWRRSLGRLPANGPACNKQTNAATATGRPLGPAARPEPVGLVVDVGSSGARAAAAAKCLQFRSALLLFLLARAVSYPPGVACRLCAD